MQKTAPVLRDSIVYIDRSLMEKILSGPEKEYDAKKASKKAKKLLRKQGLRVQDNIKTSKSSKNGDSVMKKLFRKIHMYFESRRVWKDKMHEPLKIQIIK